MKIVEHICEMPDFLIASESQRFLDKNQHLNEKKPYLSVDFLLFWHIIKDERKGCYNADSV